MLITRLENTLNEDDGVEQPLARHAGGNIILEDYIIVFFLHGVAFFTTRSFVLELHLTLLQPWYFVVR